METNIYENPVHLIFWENILVPEGKPQFLQFIEGLREYSVRFPIDRGGISENLLDKKQIFRFLTESLKITPSFIQMARYEQIFSSKFPPKSRLLLITSGERLLHQLNLLENYFSHIIVICDPSEFSRFLAPDRVIVRYFEDVAHFPENWWLPDIDPNSIGHLKKTISEITDLGEQISDICPLLRYLDSPSMLIRLVTLDALKKVVWRNATSFDFTLKKDQLISHLRQLERQELANGTPLRLQPALCDLQKTIRNIEVGQLASLGRNPAPDAFEKIRSAFESGEKDYRRAAVLAFWELGDLKALDVLEPYLSKLIDAMLPYIEQNLPVPEEMRDEEAFIRSKIHDIRENISPNYWLARKLLE